MQRLKAGRDLDRLVAEKVLGKWIYEYKFNGANDLMMFPIDENGKRVGDPRQGRNLPYFSTDRNDAVEVWECISSIAVERGGEFKRVAAMIGELAKEADYTDAITYLWHDSGAYCLCACKIALSLAEDS